MQPASGRRPTLLDLHPPHTDFRTEVIEGLGARSRRLSPMYFYDEAGSQLFDQICELPEYYPTRTEIAILEDSMPEIVQALGPDVLLVEFGSGSSRKIRELLDHLPSPAAYVPVDISRSHLMEAAEAIARDYPGLEVLPVCADFTEPIDLPRPARSPRRRIVFFPGSTVGNFEPAAARHLLESVRQDCGPGGGLLIGVDLRKDPEVLRAAYDDAAGVTAAFNLNLLRRINRELGADFVLDNFAHEIRWDEQAGRIEMHLRSLVDQTVQLGEHRWQLSAGETIHTENSHKWSIEGFAALAASAGLESDRVWTDSARLFSVHLYRVAD
ncbi:L-histidine N(alpha)-methyltransferase [bacterium]|nr:MAG: L-histidine N(alpha)-methyltransferase [bacterium]